MQREREFQSTHPCGVRRRALDTIPAAIHFNPRTRVGCDPEVMRDFERWQISIHAPVWGATAIGLIADVKIGISIHAPVWGATVFTRAATKKARISIHAPVWGATCQDFAKIVVKKISIHAPVWGATVGPLSLKRDISFQSTHPCGVRHGTFAPFRAYVQISIHAPVWGATFNHK